MTTLFHFESGGAESSELKVGDAAPQNLIVKNEEGKDVKLSDSFSTGYTLVYFYPKADTPGCTAQACSLRDDYASLEKQGVKIFGVSTDSVNAQKAFKEKYHLPFTLIADTDATVCKAFTVPVKSLSGTAARQAFLIKDNTIVWLDRSASTEKQAADIEVFLETQKK